MKLLSSYINIPLVKPGHHYAIDSVFGSSDALIIASYMQKYRKKISTLVVICADAKDVQRLLLEIKYFLPKTCIRVFPDRDTLPYDNFSSHCALISERLTTLHDLNEDVCDILLVSAIAALQLLPPTSFIASYTFKFEQNQKINEDKIRSKLSLGSYQKVNQVVNPGEYCMRGNLIDLFPMGHAFPYRIDLFDDQIDAIWSFDPCNQRKLSSVQTLRLLPKHEFPFDRASRTSFQKRWCETFKGNPNRTIPYRDVGNSIPSGGIEYYLPLFFEEMATLFDYIPINSQIVTVGDLNMVVNHFIENTKYRYNFLSHDRDRPILNPSSLFLSNEAFFVRIGNVPRLVLRRTSSSNDEFENITVDNNIKNKKEVNHFELCKRKVVTLPITFLSKDRQDSFITIRQFININYRILIIAESAGRRESIVQMFKSYPIPSLVVVEDFISFLKSDLIFAITIAPLSIGFALPELCVAIVTETELQDISPSQRSQRKYQKYPNLLHEKMRNLSDLKIGDPVVHSQHGVGRYVGLVTMNLGEGDSEFLHLEYANSSKLYIPVSNLHLVSRYRSSDTETAPLHVLGSPQWDKTRRLAAKHIRDTAAELLDLYARRAARTGYAFKFSRKDYKIFTDSFGFEETPDQTATINAVIDDMTSNRAMDRLVCGDVGFGKTEVALRAAFIAALDGKQVALLCPTTLLVEQHFRTFNDRFVQWPIRIKELSRFKSNKENAQTLKEIADGTIDIVIGTHKLLSPDVIFKSLGLIIIDEEHRFGVRHKEIMKALRAEVDILTLTATPIPRTLGMALDGLRDFSVIATPPQKRLRIKTFIRCEYDNSMIREAVLRELKRGGQIYFLHNEVKTIENRRAMLEIIIPEARIAVAHGKMNERSLERVMHDFIKQRANVLLCTTIIETGIDVPNANTILIHRADRLGLAQIYQLRGRVGRSHHQAYAYLLVDDLQTLNAQAMRRLEAIQKMEELGAGLSLSIHDLEIRGAGEILGEKQSGEIHEIGLQLYADMLANAVNAIRAGKEIEEVSPFSSTTEINLHIPAILPSNYCSEVQERLTLYKRFANCTTFEAIDSLQEELINRFGNLPLQAVSLVETHRLRLLSKGLGILKIDAGKTSINIQFSPNPPIESKQIVKILQKNKHIKMLTEKNCLQVEITTNQLLPCIQLIKEILLTLKKSESTAIQTS